MAFFSAQTMVFPHAQNSVWNSFFPFPLQSSLITAIVSPNWKMSDHKLQMKKISSEVRHQPQSKRDENVYSNYPRLRHDFNRLRKSLKTTTELRFHVWSDYFSFRQNVKEIITQLLLVSYCFCSLAQMDNKNIGFQDNTLEWHLFSMQQNWFPFVSS